MNIPRYLRKKALDQVGIEVIEGVKNLRYTMFDEDGQQTLPEYEKIDLVDLQGNREEIVAEIGRLDDQAATIAAAKAQQEAALADIDSVIADLSEE